MGDRERFRAQRVRMRSTRAPPPARRKVPRKRARLRFLRSCGQRGSRSVCRVFHVSIGVRSQLPDASDQSGWRSRRAPPQPAAPSARVRRRTRVIGDARGRRQQSRQSIRPRGRPGTVRPVWPSSVRRSRYHTIAASVAAIISSRVTPGASSWTCNPLCITSSTPRLVMIRSTTPAPVSGNVQRFRTLL